MDKTLIFGHKHPDTDTICSAIAYADLKNQLGHTVEAVRLGELNSETQFALEAFNTVAPRFVETVSNEVQKVILVDHNERQQSVRDINEVSILEVIDHHRIANFETNDPLYYRAEPVGCTATILNKLYKENSIEIPKAIAGLMLSAIISDSLLFKSPTCTDEDVTVAHELAEIAGVDPESYGLDMLKAGANLDDKTIEELISLDAKEFSLGDYKIEIAQVNTMDTPSVLNRQSELQTAINHTITQKGLDLFLFVITDILENDSTGLALGNQAPAVEKAFNSPLDSNNIILLKGVVSRKKQIVPDLTNALT